MKKILLTGGTGMVGRNIQEIAAANSIDIMAPRRSELDLSQISSVNNFLSTHQPDVIIHAAGHVGGIKANMQDPVSFLSLNSIMGLNIINAAHEHGVPQFLNISSSCMYPKDHQGKLSEDDLLGGPLEPTNEGYALAKIMTTKLCEYITETNDKRLYKTLIPCNLYGRHDNFDPSSSHLVASVIVKILHAKQHALKTVDIWGDGTARREFMNAADLANGVFYCLDRIQDLPNKMNIGVGHDHSITEYYELIANVVGWDGTFHYDTAKPTGMKQKLLNVRLQNELGWSPSIDIKFGIETVLEFLNGKN